MGSDPMGHFTFKQLICRLAYAALSESVNNNVLIIVKPRAPNVNIRCRGF